jgi:hypothetical protein
LAYRFIELLRTISIAVPIGNQPDHGPAREGRHAHCVLGHVAVVDPPGSGGGVQRPVVRAPRRPLRPATTRGARRPGPAPGDRPLPVRQPPRGLDRGPGRFVQTAGGQVGFPVAEPRLVGASSFPRHWVYDHSGRLVAKSGFIDHDTWWREAFGTHTPWGDEDSAPIVTAVESSWSVGCRWPLSTPSRSSVG